ncbi:MAG: SDR family oxidoreductase [Alphaproteobacteria bacterium]
MAAPFALDGRVALVTGASRGLGWAMARGLARAGAHVVLNGRDAARLEARAAELEAEGRSASAAPFDVTDAKAAIAAVESVVATHGRLDILVNNAGIGVRAPLAEVTDASWQQVIDADLTACFRLAREAAKPMVARRWGRIVMNASIMAQIARPSIPAYVAAKGGLVALTRALAVELAPHNVTCNAIAPGYFATDMTETLRGQSAFDAMIKSRTPMGRWGDPDELAGPAVFLASEAASYVTGHTLTVDGGLVAAL